MLLTVFGTAAAALTSLSYLPQVFKAYPKGATKDLSHRTLLALAGGLLLWVVYGFLRRDWTIVLSNAIGLVLAALVLTFKIRDLVAGRRER